MLVTAKARATTIAKHPTEELNTVTAITFGGIGVGVGVAVGVDVGVGSGVGVNVGSGVGVGNILPSHAANSTITINKANNPSLLMFSIF